MDGMNQSHVGRWTPSVTVAAIVQDEGTPQRYLLVEEHTPEGLKLNNPAGHLEPGEGPQEGVMREALEETACRFTPQGLLGVYLSRFQRPASGEDVTYVRFAYVGSAGAPEAGRTLDEGIVRTLWLTLEEVRAAATAGRLRSALVLRCLEDAAAGIRHPLGAVVADATLQVPEVKR
jgi:ADP-ribose pyrophosphatase YjhB (NUDIX family)